MTISDIITIISLVIAIVAIISEKNRKHLLLKFSYFDFGMYSIAFILINYFVFYKQFYLKGIFLDFLYFEHFGLNNPSNYSYIISIFVLITILFKVLFSFFPNRKINKVLKYYRTLIENNEMPLLLDLIERYHLKDIGKYIESSKKQDTDSERFVFERFRSKSFKEKIIGRMRIIWRDSNKYSILNKNSYASYVLHSIINDPAFVIFTSNVRPYLFATIFKRFEKEKRDSFPNDLINQFLTEILNSKNFWLIKELKQSDNFDFGQPESFFKKNKIIASLIQDLSVADVNEIWRPFGEEAIKEIENEKYIGKNSKLYQEYRNDDLLWKYKVFISIKFFNILIIESIVKKYSGTHFWLYYYRIITEKILNNFLSIPPDNFEKIESNYHNLINKMNENLLHWLSLSNEYEMDRSYDVIECLGSQIDYLTKSPYYGEARKLDFIESIIRLYCNLKENKKTDLIRNELENLLNKPSLLTEPTDTYYKYIEQVWKRFDKIPHRGYINNIDYDYFKRLKEKVITPLGLNPNEH
jgi:hypothetical protein